MNPLVLLTLAQGISGASSSIFGGLSQRELSRFNASMARYGARKVRERGQEYEARVRQKTKKTVGSQRAALAAQGLRLDVGSPADIQAETKDIGELDALTIRNNAARAAFGYNLQAISSELEGDLAFQAGITQGFNNLLTGGMQAYSYGKKFGFGTRGGP